MLIKEFADANRLKTKFTGAEDIIPGKYGELAEMTTAGSCDCDSWPFPEPPLPPAPCVIGEGEARRSWRFKT